VLNRLALPHTAVACSPLHERLTKFTFQILTHSQCGARQAKNVAMACVHKQPARERILRKSFHRTTDAPFIPHTHFFPYKQQTLVSLANNFFTAVSLSVLEKKSKNSLGVKQKLSRKKRSQDEMEKYKCNARARNGNFISLWYLSLV
jgi:hypothetical protein